MSNSYDHAEHVQDNLLLMGQMPTVTDTIKVCAGTLGRGCVVGLKSDTGEACVVDKTKNDGTQVPYAVMAETVVNQEPSEAVVYLAGEFNAEALIVGSGTVDDYKQDMRKIGLIVRDVQNRR